MNASERIHELATKTGLRFDLESAFKAGSSNGAVLVGNWLSAIDTESYDTLRGMLKITDGSYSLNSLADAIIKNRKIRMK